MKLAENIYLCDWCETKFNTIIKRVSGNGKKGVAVAQCICPNCARLVSQKGRSQ